MKLRVTGKSAYELSLMQKIAYIYIYATIFCNFLHVLRDWSLFSRGGGGVENKLKSYENM